MFMLPYFKESYLGVSLMIQKIKDTLSTLDHTAVGLFFIWLGLFIIGSLFCIHIICLYGAIAGAIFLGLALMIIGFAIL